MTQTYLEVHNLCKTFTAKNGSVEALKGVSLSIGKGEIFGVIGLSGAGKSTLVRCMNLLERPDSGDVLLNGESLLKLSKEQLRLRRQKIGMIFQHFNLLEQQTVLENVCFPLEIRGIPRKERREKALELLGVERYDLVLLDLNLPKKDGMTVLRTLRQTDRETRVLILSARSEVEDKVQGLDAGANDYLAKPFHLAELEARIRSLTLRQFTQQDVLLSCGGLTFDTRSRTAAVNGQTLTLTRKETGILEYLMVHQGRPVSQEELMDHVWDNSVDSFSNSIRVHISALRKKLRTVLGYDPIRNRIGEGYLMGGEEA